MLRARRNCILYCPRLMLLLAFSIIACFSICITCSAEDYIACPGGVCVSRNLCSSNGTVIQDGTGLIDTRFKQNSCPFDMVCCKYDETDQNSVWSEATCDGTCMPATECDSVLESLDLRTSGSGCTGNDICCRNVLEPCDGVCTLSSECSDDVDLRFNRGNCSAQQVCCRVPATVHNDACKGKCVSPSECSDYNPVLGLINLRYSNGNCPANQICCNNVKLSGKCDGLCIPRARCEESGIDLRFDGDQCPNREVCCHKPKLPAQQQDCDGTCTTLEQCADPVDNVGGIDLRLEGSKCPNNKICCKNPQSSQTKCHGTCVEQHKCPELNTWRSVINLRLSENICPFKQVCCKNPVFNGCDGKCVPSNQCNDDLDTLDLRLSASKCPDNDVCCKNVQHPTGELPRRVCEGKCVVPSSCPDYKSIDLINLRLLDNACTGGEICCNSGQFFKANLCNGSCLPREQCDDRFIDLRLDDKLCSGTAVCCKRPKRLKAVTSTSGSCDGTCLPSNLCSDQDSINLRAIHSVCSFGEVCCKVPKQEAICEGTCAPLDQCMDPQPVINLRYTNDTCLSNQICCKKLKTSKSICNGKCVPLGKCSRKSLSFNPVDLRLKHTECPKGEECCQDRELCDGSCVPRNQCDGIAVLDEINLRYEKQLCTANQICCKKIKKCNGSCVSAEKCLSVDLRLVTGECPLNQVCCKLPDQSVSCKGVCTQLDNCNDKASMLAGINLRSDDGSCPGNEICCKDLKSITTDVCNEKCNIHDESSGNGINLRASKSQNPPTQVCCKTESCRGTCVLSELCADEGINLRYKQHKCPLNRVCCQTMKERPKTVCAGRCVLPRLCPSHKPSNDPIDLRFQNNGCSDGEICCDSQISVPILSLVMDLPIAPDGPTGSTSYPTTTSSFSSSCVFSSNPSSEYVIKSDVPWLVSIWSSRNGKHRQFECSGTLVKSDLVLMPADCIEGVYTNITRLIRFGDFNLKPLNTLSSRREIEVAKVSVHPDYDSKTGFANLAVLHLSKNVSRSSSVCLPGQAKLGPKTRCFLVGWNKQNLMNGSIPNATPEKHSVILSTSAKCNEGYLCSDENQSKSQCAAAFQGSPVICSSNDSRQWIQSGLTVGKMGANEKCTTAGVPLSFVSIASHEMWIKEQITPSFQQIERVADPTRTYLPPMV